MSIRCLIIEDDFFTRDVLSLTLRRAHMDVDVVASGEEALTYLSKTHPDIAIVDLHMPHVSGYDIINTIRNNEDLKHILIMIITANPSAIKSPEAQLADAFLTKPIDIGRMITTIENLVSVRQS
jgi:CheY-like chemotaxis protein